MQVNACLCAPPAERDLESWLSRNFHELLFQDLRCSRDGVDKLWLLPCALNI